MARSVSQLIPTIAAATTTNSGLATAAQITKLETLDTDDAGATINPGAIDLSANKNYDPYAQAGGVNFVLDPAATEVNGSWISVLFTGNAAAITYSADFVAVDGAALTGIPYSGFIGPRRLMLMWDAPTGKALVALSGTAGGGGGGGGLASVAQDPAPALGGTLDGNGNAIVDVIAPHVLNVSGTLTQALHGGRACLITGTVTVPFADGFHAVLRNKSGTGRDIQAAAGGSLVYDGVTISGVTLSHLREVSVHSDGQFIWTAGAVI